MHHRAYSNGHRQTLFQTLHHKEQEGGSDWDQVFTLMRRGEKAAANADLEELAGKFASGRALVIDELKKGGQFLDWELQFMQLGMAVGDLSGIYRRIAEHYALLNSLFAELRRQLWLPLTLLLALVWGLPALAYSAGKISLYMALGNALITLIPVLLVAVLAPLLLTAYRVGWLSSSTAYRLPRIGALLARYQTYHYLSHLSMCIAAGFTLGQSLKQAARRMPESPAKARFAAVSRAVEGGARLGQALEDSGILRGVAVPPPAPGATAQDAQLQLTAAVYQSCLEEMGFWVRSLPWLLLGLVPFVIVVNAVSL